MDDVGDNGQSSARGGFAAFSAERRLTGAAFISVENSLAIVDGGVVGVAAVVACACKLTMVSDVAGA